jgi:hypothetical protein
MLAQLSENLSSSLMMMVEPFSPRHVAAKEVFAPARSASCPKLKLELGKVEVETEADEEALPPCSSESVDCRLVKRNTAEPLHRLAKPKPTYRHTQQSNNIGAKSLITTEPIQYASCAYIKHHSKRYPIIVAVSVLLHQLISTGEADIKHLHESEHSSSAGDHKDASHEQDNEAGASTSSDGSSNSALFEGMAAGCEECMKVSQKDVANFLLTCYKIARWPSEVHVHALVSTHYMIPYAHQPHLI